MEAGQLLVEARQRRGLSLHDISNTTKIPVSLLEAIERNDTERLPQGFFTRAFVRAYAAEVGIEPDHILENFDQAEIEEVPVETPVSAFPIQEPASSKSLLFVIALCAAWTMFYSGYASQSSTPVAAQAAVSAPAPDPAAAVSTASPCPGTVSVVTAVSPPARKKDLGDVKKIAAVAPIPVKDAAADPPSAPALVPATTYDAPAPSAPEAVPPQPDPAPAPAPSEQF